MKKYYLAFVIPLLINILFGETITVSGRVLDKNNNLIPGVNIYSGTAGVVSQPDGSYSINVDKTSLVTYSHIGFKNISYIATDVPIEIVMVFPRMLLIKSGITKAR